MFLASYCRAEEMDSRKVSSMAGIMRAGVAVRVPANISTHTQLSIPAHFSRK